MSDIILVSTLFLRMDLRGDISSFIVELFTLGNKNSSLIDATTSLLFLTSGAGDSDSSLISCIAESESVIILG